MFCSRIASSEKCLTDTDAFCYCRGASNSVAAAGSIGSAECSQISAKEVDLHSGKVTLE